MKLSGRSHSVRCSSWSVLWSVCLVLSGLLPSPAGRAQEPAPTQAPKITDFSPTIGEVGTEVTINGENLEGTTALWFNGQAASFRTGFFGTNLVATVPAHAVSGPITVLTPFGNHTSSSAFIVTTTPPPVITSFSPESGPVGTHVVITGENLGGASAVRFGGVDADFAFFGDTITTSVPVGARTGPISVVTPGGSRASTALFTLTTPGAPQITSVTPLRGRPGTSVTITGDNLETVTDVRFNGTPAVFGVFGSALFATVPDGASSGKITVTAAKGTGTSPQAFEVVAASAPEITGFSPDTGVVGTKVTVTGTHFVGVTAVRFGQGLSTDFTVVSDTQLIASVPADGSNGPIAVTTPAETGASSAVFYLPAAVTGFEPSHGIVGTSVTIHGRNLTGALAVLFGGGVSAAYTNVSNTEIRATVPEGATSGAVAVATPSGFGISDQDFLLPPKISQVDPQSGPPLSTVTITGENLTGVTSVRFGNAEALFSPVSLTALTAVVPANGNNGPVTVTTPAGSAASPEPFFVGLFADLNLGLTASPESVAIGDFLRYSLTVTNRGPIAAPDVIVTDRLPAGVSTVFAPSGADCTEANGVITCHVGTLAAGADVAIRITVIINAGDYLTNQVSVTSTANDPDLNDNTAAQVTILKGAPPPPPPDEKISLRAVAGNGALELSWPATADGYVLETASSLTAATNWTAQGSQPVVIDGRKTVTVSTATGAKFYRLKKP